MNARTLAILALLIPALAASTSAAEKLWLSRTLLCDFAKPGTITKVSGSGEKPVDEKVGEASYILSLTEKVRMRISIADANEPAKHYHIVIEAKDSDRPEESAAAALTPYDASKNVWYGSYRFLVTVIDKEADRNRFRKATIRLDVYAPGD